MAATLIPLAQVLFANGDISPARETCTRALKILQVAYGSTPSVEVSREYQEWFTNNFLVLVESHTNTNKKLQIDFPLIYRFSLGSRAFLEDGHGCCHYTLEHVPKHDILSGKSLLLLTSRELVAMLTPRSEFLAVSRSRPVRRRGPTSRVGPVYL